MTTGSLFVTAFIVGLSGALMPGPLLTVVVGQVAGRGFWAGPRAVAGHGLLEVMVVVGLAFGFGRYLAQPSVTGVIGVAGGAVLIWLAWQTGRSAGEVARGLADLGGAQLASGAGEGRPRGLPEPFLAGLAASAGNPYWVLWWATVGAEYVTLALAGGAMAVAAFYAGHILSDLVWYAAVSGTIAGGRRLFGPGTFRAVLVACGVFLAGLGVYFVFSGARLLAR
ncbi:MAG: LysE family transporter [Bacillota bacterium]